jgi:hypothetical protein
MESLSVTQTVDGIDKGDLQRFHEALRNKWPRPQNIDLTQVKHIFEFVYGFQNESLIKGH